MTENKKKERKKMERATERHGCVHAKFDACARERKK